MPGSGGRPGRAATVRGSFACQDMLPGFSSWFSCVGFGSVLVVPARKDG